jgi:hypothetical protein
VTIVFSASATEIRRSPAEVRYAELASLNCRGDGRADARFTIPTSNRSI